MLVGTTGRLTAFHIHHVALTYDGSTLRLFIDGVLAASTAASGSWTIPPYESFELADQSPSTYLGMSTTTNVTPAFYDSIRISNTARYTSNFTPPTAKFTADANTMFLENFPTNVDVDLTDSIKRFVTKDSIKDFVYLDWVTVAKNRAAWTKAYDAAVKSE